MHGAMLNVKITKVIKMVVIIIVSTTAAGISATIIYSMFQALWEVS